MDRGRICEAIGRVVPRVTLVILQGRLYAATDLRHLLTMKIADIPQLRDLPVAEKLLLVEELWAEITAKSDSLPLPEWHVRELDRSLADYHADPRAGSPWPEVRARILAPK